MTDLPETMTHTPLLASLLDNYCKWSDDRDALMDAQVSDEHTALGVPDVDAELEASDEAAVELLGEFFEFGRRFLSPIPDDETGALVLSDLAGFRIPADPMDFAVVRVAHKKATERVETAYKAATGAARSWMAEPQSNVCDNHPDRDATHCHGGTDYFCDECWLPGFLRQFQQITTDRNDDKEGS